jgi:hypothetical protein
VRAPQRQIPTLIVLASYPDRHAALLFLQPAGAWSALFADYTEMSENNRDIAVTPLFDRESHLEERASGSRSVPEYWARTPAESGKLLALERCLSRLPADRIQPRAQPAFQ